MLYLCFTYALLAGGAGVARGRGHGSWQAGCTWQAVLMLYRILSCFAYSLLAGCAGVHAAGVAGVGVRAWV
jgi:hypothetical protein